MQENPFKNQENSEPVFTPELKQKLSDSFMQSLNEGKIEIKEREHLLRNVIGAPESFIEAEHGLSIFRNALYKLIKNSDFPDCKNKMILRQSVGFDLSTLSLRSFLDKLNKGEISKEDFHSIESIKAMHSYLNSVNLTLSTLKEILTPEVNVAIHAYAEEIFIKPYKQAIENFKETKE